MVPTLLAVAGAMLVSNRIERHSIYTIRLGRDGMTIIVGSASIKEVVNGDSLYEWHLVDVKRAKRFRKPKGHPQPVWFTPFWRSENIQLGRQNL